ncbi:MAG TPA: hypothetical protein VD948_12730 [Rhodothermales bacterium]|nr:hypothetical protein [Rhodothermales bacterium]
MTYDDYYQDDYYNGRIAAIEEQTSQAAVANATSITASGTTAQIVGFDSGGNPAPKNVAGDSNGAGLAFSGDTLTATLPQGLKAADSPTFVGLTLTTLLVGSGGVTIKKVASGTISAVNPGSIAAQTRGSVDATLTGVAAGDIVILAPPDALDSGLAYVGNRVTAGNTVRIYLANVTAGAIDDSARDWDYLWIDIT